MHRLIHRATRLPYPLAHGFSLVEVLVALVVMSVGMLGIAGLFANSLAAGRTAAYRQHAVILAGDVAERIRANPGGGGAYEGPGSDSQCNTDGSNCTDEEMASHDIFLWRNVARNALPGGSVSIAYDSASAPPRYSIAIAWDEPGEDPAAPLRYAITILAAGRRE